MPVHRTKKTEVDLLRMEIADALQVALATGIQPIPLKLRLMRHYWALATNCDPSPTAPIINTVFAELAADQATEIAPYIHPKIASVEHRGNIKDPVRLVMAAEDTAL